jgi:hypothetical protein
LRLHVDGCTWRCQALLPCLSTHHIKRYADPNGSAALAAMKRVTLHESAAHEGTAVGSAMIYASITAPGTWEASSLELVHLYVSICHNHGPGDALRIEALDTFDPAIFPTGLLREAHDVWLVVKRAHALHFKYLTAHISSYRPDHRPPDHSLRPSFCNWTW